MINACLHLYSQISLSFVFDMVRTGSSKMIYTIFDVASNVFSTQIPFFVEPNHECLVECLPTCKSESNLPK